MYCHSLCLQAAKGLSRLRRCTVLSEPFLVAHVLSTKITYVLTHTCFHISIFPVLSSQNASQIRREIWRSSSSPTNSLVRYLMLTHNASGSLGNTLNSASLRGAKISVRISGVSETQLCVKQSFYQQPKEHLVVMVW